MAKKTTIRNKAGSSRRTKTGKQIASVKHKDKRKNIPTEELRNFMTEEAQQPTDVKYPGLLYARDPSLDPQLVWKGKDEQDQEELTVPAVPIYIQEKIHPQAIIEDIRAEARRKATQEQLNLFADFNGIPFEDLIDFYHHESNWSNRLILGDSLLAMTSLAEKEGLKGQVQMIYVDPPYGIKFNSNWQVSTRKRDIKDGKAEDATRQPEQIRAFRDTWKLGIHSYLSYLRDRLIVSRELLTESGSIFVQIGDENVHVVRSLMDEVFGSDNFVSLISFRTKIPLNPIHIANIADYVIWYAKKKEQVKFRRIFTPRDTSKHSLFEPIRFPDGSTRKGTLVDLMASGYTESCHFEFFHEGRRAYPPGRNSWKTTPTGMQRLLRARRVRWMKTVPRYVGLADDYPVMEISNQWADTQGAAGKTYVVQTSDKVIGRCLLMTTDPGDLVLDPTCGSGTTAHIAEQWGRRWITIDTSRVALTLARTRLMAARFPYYILVDSPEGLQKEAETTGAISHEHKTGGNIKRGFVCKRVPHITIGAIANNADVDEIDDRYQPQLDELRAKINQMCDQKWEEWQIPADPPASVSKQGKQLIRQYWTLWRERQDQMDTSIGANAEQEILVDQPYKDNKRIRVSGPFTVESLSPHRSISFHKKNDLKEKGIEGWRVDVRGAGEFGNIIIENLKKAGVQNTIKNERLKFDRLEPYAGTWIHAEGEYEEKAEGGKLKAEGKTKRVAVCIGPEHGTVGAELVKEAAKEAVKGVGFDLLLICGFAFDPSVDEETKRYGKLQVLATRMNPDLAMGDELLKKTGSGNLFMVFGEPDLDVHEVPDEKTGGRASSRAASKKLQVEIKGLDVYDPTTGQIRNSSTDDIACWFIDTNYNEESFFVRHAYFTGGDEPYDKLKRALRAEIDEAAWSALYSTVSRPFDKPETGKIAVKVINHYGDEVLKVYEV